GISVLPYTDETLPGAEESLFVLAGWLGRACPTRWSNRSSCDNLFSFGKQFQISGAISGPNPRFWTREDPLRSDVSAVGAVANQKYMIVHHRDQVISRVDFHANRPIQLCFGAVQDADRCHIAIRIGPEYQDRIVGKRRGHEFAVNRIHRDVIDRAQECLWTLSDTERCFVPDGTAAENQNRLSKRIGYRELIMDRIHRDVVACAGLKRFRTLDHSCGLSISIRRTGVCRDSRLAHSVGSQNLFPLRVICDCANSTHTGQGSVFRSRTNHTERRDVPVRHSGKHSSNVTVPTGHPQLVAFRVDGNTDRAFHLRCRSFQHSYRSRV